MALTVYNGDKPYIFISYSHKDSYKVLPIVESLIASGFRVWYDAGIVAGTEWPEFIASKLLRSACVITFISKSALTSQNCTREINFAISENKEMLSVYLEDVMLTPGMKMQLGTVQGIYYYRASYETFVQNLKSTPILNLCREYDMSMFDAQRYSNMSASEGLALELDTNANGYIVIGIGTCTDTDIVIPRIYNGKPVIGIGVGDEVSSFFSNARLKTLMIPDSVTSIESGVFSGCSDLRCIVVDKNNPIYRSEGNCLIETANQTIIQGCYNSIIPNTVTSIGDFAFAGCGNLKSIIIPKGVTSIGVSAFYGCSSLTNIIIPNSVTSIADGAFFECERLINIEIPASVTEFGYGVFDCCTNLISITLPHGLKIIGAEMFNFCVNLVRVTIPESVISIGDGAFRGCSGLASVTIPESVMSIGESAFEDCVELTAVTIPKGVTSIGRNAFNGCSGLTSITIPESVISIEESAFSGCNSLTDIIIPNSVQIIEPYAFSSCNSLKSVFISEGVKSIGEGCFWGCDALTNINLPNGIKDIGKHALYGCDNLFKIIIPKSVVSIGFGAFQQCDNLVIYCEAEVPYMTRFISWDIYWNYSDCPVIWGYRE